MSRRPDGTYFALPAEATARLAELLRGGRNEEARTLQELMNKDAAAIVQQQQLAQQQAQQQDQQQALLKQTWMMNSKQFLTTRRVERERAFMPPNVTSTLDEGLPRNMWGELDILMGELEMRLLRRLPLEGTWDGIALLRAPGPIWKNAREDAYTFTWIWTIGTRRVQSSGVIPVRSLESVRSENDMEFRIAEPMWLALRELVDAVDRMLGQPPRPSARKSRDAEPVTTTDRGIDLK